MGIRLDFKKLPKEIREQINCQQNVRALDGKGWHTFSGIKYYFRSAWEVRYAHHLQTLIKFEVIKSWVYEPKTFWFESIKSGCRSYKPDFYIENFDGSHYWVEVKGYMDQKSQTKIKRFRKYYPDENLRIVDAPWFSGH